MIKAELREQYRLKLTKLHLITISVISLVEITAYFFFAAQGVEKLSISSSYLWLCVMLPIALNYTGHWVARKLIKKPNMPTAQKDAAITYAILVTSASMAMVHREYVVCLCSFTFPLVLCGFFNNRRLLNLTVLLSLAALTATTGMLASEQNLDITFLVNQVTAYGFVLISYLSSVTAINFSHNSFAVISHQEKENHQLHQKIRLDQMTGAYNHTTYTEEIASAVESHNAEKTVFCLAMVDLDNFKTVNDTYGHDRGDQVLIALCDILRKHIGTADVLCRYGWEEFAVILREKSLAEAKRIMEAAREDFHAQVYPFTERHITFSCGLCQHQPQESPEALFIRADRLLYDAKGSGKNRVCIGTE